MRLSADPRDEEGEFDWGTEEEAGELELVAAGVEGEEAGAAEAAGEGVAEEDTDSELETAREEEEEGEREVEGVRDGEAEISKTVETV